VCGPDADPGRFRPALHAQATRLVAASADDHDLVVIAGDLLDMASIVAPDAQIAVVLEYLARMSERTQLVVCSGNHDLDDVTSSTNAPRGGWSRPPRSAWWSTARASTPRRARHRVRVLDGPKSREQVGEQLAADAELWRDGPADRPWIWAYHAPPDDSPTS